MEETKTILIIEAARITEETITGILPDAVIRRTTPAFMQEARKAAASRGQTGSDVRNEGRAQESRYQDGRMQDARYQDSRVQENRYQQGRIQESGYQENRIHEYRENTVEDVKADLQELDSGIEAKGILEVMSDGFGFIRCENFLPGDNDVYVAPSQIRRFNLKTGDIVQGSRRIKTATEKFAALLYIETIKRISHQRGRAQA